MRMTSIAAVALALSLPLAACHKPASAPKIDPAKAAAAQSEGQAFLTKNATAPGVVTLPTGVQYKIITSGPVSGNSPRPADEIKVMYEGKLLDGTMFDSSFQRGAPITAPLHNLIPGWTDALTKMRPGDEWEVWTPPSRAYGDEAKGPIPANSVLDFRIQLIDFLPATRQTAQG
jgi:FKBP-type peptidyl-prolyl cis-trans isomerase